MRQRIALLRLLAIGLGTLLALTWPLAVRAECWATDVACATDAWVYGEQMKWSLGFWQINRGGLVMARWIEDLRVWLTETLFVSLFTELTKPIAFLFWLAIIAAWGVFIISFMVQSLIDLNWVDLRRSTRPILLALVVFQFGGPLLQGTEQLRLMLTSMVTTAVAASVSASTIPTAPTVSTGDLPPMATIYDDNPCSGMALSRSPSTMQLNDYTARYVWANAADIHCPPNGTTLASGFQNRYFSTLDLRAVDDAGQRATALQQAGQGVNVQATALLLMVGAIIEQTMHLIFALALGLAWFGLLFTLVLAVFLPTEHLFTQQLMGILGVFKASMLAALMVGFGLALINTAAQAGNGALVLVSGLVLMALLIWQCKQAIGTMAMGAGSLNAALGKAPQAVGRMAGGWAKTAVVGGAVVAGVMATGGGMGAILGQMASGAVRRSGRSLGDTPVTSAAARVLTNRLADRIDARLHDSRLREQAETLDAEATWYERLPVPDAFAQERAARLRIAAAQQRARGEERTADRLSDAARRRERSPILRWQADGKRQEADTRRRAAQPPRPSDEGRVFTAGQTTIPLQANAMGERLPVAPLDARSMPVSLSRVVEERPLMRRVRRSRRPTATRMHRSVGRRPVNPSRELPLRTTLPEAREGEWTTPTLAPISLRPSMRAAVRSRPGNTDAVAGDAETVQPTATIIRKLVPDSVVTRPLPDVAAPWAVSVTGTVPATVSGIATAPSVPGSAAPRAAGAAPMSILPVTSTSAAGAAPSVVPVTTRPISGNIGPGATNMATHSSRPAATSVLVSGPVSVPVLPTPAVTVSSVPSVTAEAIATAPVPSVAPVVPVTPDMDSVPRIATTISATPVIAPMPSVTPAVLRTSPTMPVIAPAPNSAPATSAPPLRSIPSGQPGIGVPAAAPMVPGVAPAPARSMGLPSVTNVPSMPSVTPPPRTTAIAGAADTPLASTAVPPPIVTATRKPMPWKKKREAA